MRVTVYVEGPSDKLSLERLLDSEIEIAKQKGWALNFIARSGKDDLLRTGTRKAVGILRNNSEDHVFVVPDLYPLNKAFHHSSEKELNDGMKKSFEDECERLNLDSKELLTRFHPHCFKYDMEVLLLASYNELLSYLKLQKPPASIKWASPPEEQNNDVPPKRVVEKLFIEKQMKYVDTIDAPKILSNVSALTLCNQLTQCFKPFYLELGTICGFNERS